MNTWDDLLGVSSKRITTKINLFVWSWLVVVLIQQGGLSENTVEGDGEPLGEGLLGAVLKSRGHGPLDGRHQRKASARLHGH